MPWINVAELLRQLLNRGIDPEDAAVYNPDSGPEDTDDEED